MNFYIVDDAYIAYLKKIDPKAPNNYGGGKAFVGIVLQINGCKYFAPLTSYKEKQDRIRNDSPTSVKLHERGNPDNKLGMIQLNNMIPVPDAALSLLDFSTQEQRYVRMLQKQFEYIRTVDEEIQEKAQRLYKLVCVDQHKTFVSLSCDFRVLEEALGVYGAK